MKFPKKLKVGAQQYTIIYPWVFKEEDSMVGLHENREGVIKVAETFRGDRIPDNKIKQTLLHEIMHAIDFYYLSHMLTEDESIIDRFATGWLSIFMNNNINFTSNKFTFPKTLKMNDFTYKINYPYEYLDMAPAPLFSVDTNMNNIKFSIEHKRCSIDVMKMNMVHAITVVINCENDILGSSKLYNNGNPDLLPKDFVIEILANGMFQVIVDNDLEKVIRQNGKLG